MLQLFQPNIMLCCGATGTQSCLPLQAAWWRPSLSDRLPCRAAFLAMHSIQLHEPRYPGGEARYSAVHNYIGRMQMLFLDRSLHVDKKPANLGSLRHTACPPQLVSLQMQQAAV